MDMSKMTTDELQIKLDDVSKNLASVKTQLEFAKSEANETGNYSDSRWFNSARHAARMLGREHQMVMQELGRRRKAERRAFNASAERRFVDIAKIRLDPELFDSLWRDASEGV